MDVAATRALATMAVMHGAESIGLPRDARSRRFPLPLQRALAPLAIGLMAALLAFERLPRGTRRTLWAEDGSAFLQDAMRGQHDPLAAYAGYLHVLPRMVALLVANALEVPRYAVATNVSACLLTGLVAAVVYIGAEDVIPGVLERSWLALMTVLCPVLGVEVLANMANLHSIMMWGAFWALWRHPRTLAGALALAGFALLATLSEVQSVLWVPLALVALWRHHTLRQALVTAACVAGAASQLLTALTHQRESDPHLLSLSIVSQLLGMEIVMPLWLVSTERILALIEAYGWWLPALAAVPLFVGLTLALRHGTGSQRAATGAALGAGLVIFCASHMLNGFVAGGEGYSVLQQAPVLIRYAVAPSLFFLAPVAIGAAAARQRSGPRARWLGVGALTMLLLGPATNFRVEENARDPHTSWNKQLRKARAGCSTGSAQEYPFQISPPSWEVLVPCSRLVQAR